MSEIAKRRKLCTSVQSEPAISEHAQEHAPPFRAAVLDKSRQEVVEWIGDVRWEPQRFLELPLDEIVSRARDCQIIVHQTYVELVKRRGYLYGDKAVEHFCA